LRRAAGAAALVALLLGCGPSEAQKTELARLTVHSWTATLHKTADALERGTVPATYARQVVSAAQEARDQESAGPQWSELPAEERAALDQAIHQLAARVGQSGEPR
jgi:hypothetical protein